MNWTQTSERTWQATFDRGTLFVTQRRTPPGELFAPNVFWPTVQLGTGYEPLMREETLEAAQRACEERVFA